MRQDAELPRALNDVVVRDDIARFRHDDARAGRRAVFECGNDRHDAGAHFLIDPLKAQRALGAGNDCLHAARRRHDRKRARRILRMRAVLRRSPVVGRVLALRERLVRIGRLCIVLRLRRPAFRRVIRAAQNRLSVVGRQHIPPQHLRRAERSTRQKRHDEQRHDRALAALGALRRAHRRAAALAVIALSAVIAARPRGVIALTLRLALLAAARSVRIIYRIVIIEAGMVPFLIAHCDTFLSLEI